MVMGGNTILRHVHDRTNTTFPAGGRHTATMRRAGNSGRSIPMHIGILAMSTTGILPVRLPSHGMARIALRPTGRMALRSTTRIAPRSTGKMPVGLMGKMPMLRLRPAANPGAPGQARTAPPITPITRSPAINQPPHDISGTPNWIDPAYDDAGNMTAGPKPGDETATTSNYTYDAWNRLVKVADGATTVAEYRYDPGAPGRLRGTSSLHRRIRKYVADGEDWTVTEYYYNAAWQLLETRKAEDVTRTGSPLAEPAVAETVHEQYVWSQRYIDAPILRDRQTDDNVATGALGKANSGLDERIYYCTDAQMSITAIVDGTPDSQTIGQVLERYLYDPYGQVTIYNPGWTATQSAATYDNAILYCGHHHDAETSLYHVRNRMHHSQLGRWLTRDPLGYVDGMSLYQYCGSKPTVRLDELGLAGGGPWMNRPSQAEMNWQQTINSYNADGVRNREHHHGHHGPGQFDEWCAKRNELRRHSIDPDRKYEEVIYDPAKTPSIEPRLVPSEGEKALLKQQQERAKKEQEQFEKAHTERIECLKALPREKRLGILQAEAKAALLNWRSAAMPTPNELSLRESLDVMHAP